MLAPLVKSTLFELASLGSQEFDVHRLAKIACVMTAVWIYIKGSSKEVSCKVIIKGRKEKE